VKKAYFTFLSLISIMALLPSCATVDKAEVKSVAEKPKISPTIQYDKANIGEKKGLKRKVAIARFTNETKYGQSWIFAIRNAQIREPGGPPTVPHS